MAFKFFFKFREKKHEMILRMHLIFICYIFFKIAHINFLKILALLYKTDRITTHSPHIILRK